MAFSSKQVAALRRNVDQRHIRIRQSNGRELSYLEGWYVISQANRIFGFDGWSRETLESKCVLARENRGYFTAVYTAKVRLTVQAEGITIVREGHGTGEGRGEFPGEVHDTALKAAETDATKRALITFGRPFGLELYRDSQAARQRQGAADGRRALPSHSAGVPTAQAVPKRDQTAHAVDRAAKPVVATDRAQPSPAAGQESPPSPLPVQTAPELAPVAKFARDDTTPIPRPSTYYGREHYHDIREENAGLMRQAARHAASEDLIRQTSHQTPLQPTQPTPERIDKSALPLGEPKRIRDKEHLKFVGTQTCLVCGRQPSDAHHLRFAQPRALDTKVSDEFTVPLCRTHHRNLHQTGNEISWWEKIRIEPLPIARKLWETSHPRVASRSTTPTDPPAALIDKANPIAAVRS